MNESQEVAIVKQQATKALNAANEVKIETQEQYEGATDLLSKIKQVGKMLKERKEEITRPLMDALNSARDLFKPIEQSHAEAERIIKSKMVSYQDEQERIQAIERAKIAARVEKGTMKQETAIKKMEAMPEVPTTAHGKVGMVSTRIMKKLVITDENAVPREYCSPDSTKIKAALDAGKEVLGAKYVEEKVISAR